MSWTRRRLLGTAAAAIAGAAIPSSTWAQRFLTSSPNNPKGRRVIYRLSLRGRRGSRAAKKHNANMRFATQHAAHTHRAHAGDRSRIVPLTVSIEEYHRLFVSRHSLVADLRALGGVKPVRFHWR